MVDLVGREVDHHVVNARLRAAIGAADRRLAAV
jgi:hypothetical protein